MTNFLLIAGTSLAVVMLLLIVPLLRQHRQPLPSDDSREYDIRIARERLEELRKEHASGELSDEEFEQAKVDLEIALAQDLDAVEKDTLKTIPDRSAIATVIAVIVLVPVIVAGVYFKTGSPSLIDTPPQQMAASTTAESTAHKPGSIAELAGELEKRMQQEPSNPKGWFLLGRTYMKLKRYDNAIRAFGKLNDLSPNNPTVLISMADALSMQNGGKVPDQAVTLLDKVLELAPENPTALWLRGNAAGQRRQDTEALKFWARAWPLLAQEPALQQELGNLIRAVEQRSGLKADLPKTPPPIMTAGTNENGTSPVPATGGPSLTVEVALDAELMDKVSPNDIVFIYAKAFSGPPMPLAVVRKRVSELPVKVELNDGMAMMPQMRLSSFPRVKVGARVSKSGRPIPQVGDLQAPEMETPNDSNQPIQLLINNIRQ